MPDDLNQLPQMPGNSTPTTDPDPFSVPSDPSAPTDISPPVLPPLPPIQDFPPLPEQPLPQPQEPAPDLPPLTNPLSENQGSAAPGLSNTSATASFAVPANPKRRIPGKLMMGIAVILFLVASIPAGVFLVQQRQILQQRAAGEPTATITGPVTGNVTPPQGLTYTVNAQANTGNLTKGEIYIARTDGTTNASDWGCVQHDQSPPSGIWCRLNRVTLSQSNEQFSATWWPPKDGEYYVATVAFNSNGQQCSNNPFVQYPFNNNGVIYTNCGSSPVKVTIGGGGGGGVAPTANLTGPATGSVGAQQGLKYTVSAQAGSGSLTKGELYIARTDGTTNASDWGCVQHDQSPPSGIWCRLNRVTLAGTSASFDGTWSPPKDGEYYVSTNVFNSNNKQCSNNPFVQYPFNNNGVVYENCGSPAVKVTIGIGGGAGGLEITSFQQPNSPSTGDPIALKVQGKGTLAKVYLHGSSAPTTGDGAPITTPWDPNKLVPNNKFWFVKQIDGTNNVIDSTNANITFIAPNVAGKYYLVANAVSGSDTCAWDGFKYTNGTKGSACTNVSGPNPPSFNVLGTTASFTTAPLTGNINQKLSYKAHATASPGNGRALKKGEMWVTRKDGAAFTCSSNKTIGPWCLLTTPDPYPLTGAAADISADWTPDAAGLYYVAANVFDDRSQCSGNPLVDFPWENPTTHIVYSSCGANSNVLVNIGGPGPQCLNIAAYDSNFNALTLNALTQLKAGDKVRFAVRGQGTIDKARFRINGAAWLETTNKKDVDEYWIEYTIPAGTQTFQIDGEVHDSGLNQWL
ncbi:MAG: hypothetical protein Q8P89_02385 [bacterium]|nr:hypothetical protein [bacterium]